METNIENTAAPSVEVPRLVRRVIAIATAGVANTRNTQCDHITTALCDDGSMWELRDNTAHPRWTRLPDICGMCGGLGIIGGQCGQTAETFEERTETCPECEPNDQALARSEAELPATPYSSANCSPRLTGNVFGSPDAVAREMQIIRHLETMTHAMTMGDTVAYWHGAGRLEILHAEMRASWLNVPSSAAGGEEGAP